MKKYILTKPIFRTAAYALAYTFPIFVFAQETFGGLITRLTNSLVNPIIALIVGLAVVLFFWGLVQFISGAGSQAKRDEGKQRMLWGIIALFVMFSLWGIVLVLVETFFPGGPDPIFMNLQ